MLSICNMNCSSHLALSLYFMGKLTHNVPYSIFCLSKFFGRIPCANFFILLLITNFRLCYSIEYNYALCTKSSFHLLNFYLLLRIYNRARENVILIIMCLQITRTLNILHYFSEMKIP